MELLRGIIITAFLFVVVSCGGGGGGLTRDGGGTPPTPTPETTIALSISSTDISSQNPATVTATVMRGTTPVTGVVVNFSATLGVLSPNSGTALTNSSGVAEIVLTAGSVRGAGEITASLSSDSTVSASLGFNTQGDDTGTVGDINITLSLVDGDGAVTDTITASKPGRIIATVNGITASSHCYFHDYSW